MAFTPSIQNGNVLLIPTVRHGVAVRHGASRLQTAPSVQRGPAQAGPEVLGLAEGVDVVPEQRTVLADDDHADLVEPHADRFGEVVLGESGDREQLHRLAIVPPVAEAGAGVRARGDVDEHEVVGLGVACNQVDGSSRLGRLPPGRERLVAADLEEAGCRLDRPVLESGIGVHGDLRSVGAEPLAPPCGIGAAPPAAPCKGGSEGAFLAPSGRWFSEARRAFCFAAFAFSLGRQKKSEKHRNPCGAHRAAVRAFDAQGGGKAIRSNGARRAANAPRRLSEGRLLGGSPCRTARRS